MRTCLDSITASDIPLGSELVAGYVDGRYRWSDADWARFPDEVKVRIAVFASTNDGHVLDVELGNATPDEAPGWVRMRRAAGVIPTCYVNASNWQASRDAFASVGEPEPLWWLAHYDNDPQIPEDAVAKQYQNAVLTGGHFDRSSVRNYWPGIDAHDPRIPKYAGQGAKEIDLDIGEVQVTEAFYDYDLDRPDGTRLVGRRALPIKIIGREPGVSALTFYPPADPDGDPTIEVSARPAMFIVTVRQPA